VKDPAAWGWLLITTAQWYSAGLRAGWSGVRVPPGAGKFLFTTTSKQAQGPTRPVGNWSLFPGRGVKRTTHLPILVRSRILGAIPPLTTTPSLRGSQLKKPISSIHFNDLHLELQVIMTMNVYEKRRTRTSKASFTKKDCVDFRVFWFMTYVYEQQPNKRGAVR
jgi:hypothetical protein